MQVKDSDDERGGCITAAVICVFGAIFMGMAGFHGYEIGYGQAQRDARECGAAEAVVDKFGRVEYRWIGQAEANTPADD